MHYIVLDMEWNQAWPGSYAAKKVLPSPIRGEIIQIGAVRLLADGSVADEFQILVRPKYYKKMNRKVSSLTGIKDALLKEQGVPFPEAAAKFRSWCGEDCIVLTWGYDDVPVLKENLRLHSLDDSFPARFYNAQLIFNAQTDGGSNQKALSTALEMMNIEPSRPAHDALGDAYHTALICSKLRLEAGIATCEEAAKNHAGGFHGELLPDCVGRQVYHGYADKTAALGAMGARENRCPECGETMRLSGRWVSQPGHRYMAMAACPEHGKYLVRVRLIQDEDGTMRVNRLVYTAASEAAQAYEAQAARPRKHPRKKRVSAKPKQ